MTTREYQGGVSDPNTDVWIISGGRHSQFDLSAIEDAKKNEQVKAVKEYRISDIAYYLLNPNPIEVYKRLIGCEIHYQQQLITRILEKIKRLFPRSFRRLWNGHMIPPEILLSHSKIEMPTLKDKALEDHLHSIYESLRAYDSASKRLPQLDLRGISVIPDLGHLRCEKNLRKPGISDLV